MSEESTDRRFRRLEQIVARLAPGSIDVEAQRSTGDMKEREKSLKHTVCGLTNSGYDWTAVDGATTSRPMCPRCLEIASRACVQLEPPAIRVYTWAELNFPSSISMNCPHCQHIINIPEEGLPGRCPKCGYWHIRMGIEVAVSYEKMEYMPNV